MVIIQTKGAGMTKTVTATWNFEPMPNFTPKAWMIDTDLIPEI